MKKKETNKNLVWLFDIDTYLAICELAKKHGKKAGDSMQEEFIEVMKFNRKKFELLGYTNKDIDLLTGEMREKGLKVYNPKEKQRRKRGNKR